MSQWGQPAVDDLEPWQLQCPNDHTSWKAIDGHYWCRSCDNSESIESADHEYVVNVKTGDHLDREDVRELEQQAQRERLQREQNQPARGD